MKRGSRGVIMPATQSVGYSGTPLSKKLGLKPGHRVLVLDGPRHYRRLLDPCPADIAFVSRVSAHVDVVHLFVTSEKVLERQLKMLRERLATDATVWVSWPKKSSGVASTVGEDTIRALALPLGFVDVKVCAVTEIWSGLKLVVRKALRPG